jgi:hypothetical protein
MARAFQRDRFTWLPYLLLAFYGYFLNILGPIKPFLKEELSLGPKCVAARGCCISP